MVSVTKAVANDVSNDEVVAVRTSTPPQTEKIEVVRRTLVTRHHEYPIIATETVSIP